MIFKPEKYSQGEKADEAGKYPDQPALIGIKNKQRKNQAAPGKDVEPERDQAAAKPVNLYNSCGNSTEINCQEKREEEKNEQGLFD